MAPTGEPRSLPTKKSLRIWVRNGGHVMRKKTRETYNYPKTVEAAKDPFDSWTGKNKMFYLIAINLYPESQIIRADDTDSEEEMEEVESTEASEEVSPKSSSKQTSDDFTSDSSLQPNSSSENDDFPEQKCRKLTTAPMPSKRRWPTRLTKSRVSSTSSSPGEKRSATSSDCENCLSESPPKVSSVSAKIAQGVKTSASLSSRKQPPIPTIMNSLNKIIENCSATGVVSFSLPKHRPRQSRS